MYDSGVCLPFIIILSLENGKAFCRANLYILLEARFRVCVCVCEREVGR